MRLWPGAWLISLVVFCLPVDAEAAGLIVKFRGEGPHALTRCAEQTERSGQAFAAATADGSPSLDRVVARHRLRGFRALFRSGEGRSLAGRRAALRRRLAARVGPGEPLPDLAHVYTVELPEGAAPDEVAETLAADPHVEFAQADHAHGLDVLPNDPFLTSRGAWGQDFEDLWGLHRIRAPEAWEISRGEGVVVAVVDSGLDYLHPDIADNVYVHPGEDLDGNGRVDPSDWNGIDDDGNGFVDDLIGFDFANSVDADGDGFYDGPDDLSDPDPFDDNGHGSHVAGTIAAVADNGIGIAGVAPGAKIMPLKGFRESGPSPDSVLWRAVLYAIENGAQVINNSWSCFPACPVNPLADEMTALARRAGVVIVTSASNHSTDVISNRPENSPDVITVASLGEDGDLSRSFSNFGFQVDVLAPGGDPSNFDVPLARNNILSLLTSAIDLDERLVVGGQYRRLAGTSMSAPHVAGVVALLRAERPELGVGEIRRILRQSAVDLGAPGFDRETAAGLVDALGALTLPPLPDMEIRFEAPAQRAVIRPGAVVVVSGEVVGADVATWRLDLGAGADPADWTPLETGTAGVIGELARWETAGLGPGSYVLRLQATATDGSQYVEFVQLSLEGSAFEAWSTLGEDAIAPAIDDGFVVWQSRRQPDDPELRSPVANIFANRLSDGAEFVLAADGADQTSPSISGNIVAWFERDPETDESAIAGCWLDRRSGACARFEVPADPSVTLAPMAVAGRVFWIDSVSGVQDLHGCLPDPTVGRCVEYALGLPPATRTFPTTDGSRLTWVESVGGRRVASCEVDPESGACDPLLSRHPVNALSRPAASADLLAFVEFSFQRTEPLMLCEWDAETGDCFPFEVDRGVSDPVPTLLGNRLFWSRPVGDEAFDVFYCEYDRLLGVCPAQRLTSEMSEQFAPAVDDDRVVFVDRRDGGARIYSRTLPSIAPIPELRVSVGERLRVPLRAREGSGEAITLSLEGAVPGGPFLRARPARRGRARGLLVWRPAPGSEGEHVVTVVATSASGLVSRQSARIQVDPPNHPPEVVVVAEGFAAIGRPTVLDACASSDPDGDALTFHWRDGAGRSLGEACRIEVSSRRFGGRQYRVTVSDGRAEVREPVRIVWLPGFLVRWLSRVVFAWGSR